MQKKSIHHYMRSLHRDIGFLVIGLTLVYGLSGIVLIYRDTDFLKQERQIEKQVNPNTAESELAMMLHLRDLKITKTEGDMVYFENGTYNKATGQVIYTSKALPPFFEKLNSLHKSSSHGAAHWFTTIFGILLIFLAISSFWMFQTKTKMFRRGIYFAAAGILLTIILLIL